MIVFPALSAKYLLDSVFFVSHLTTIAPLHTQQPRDVALSRKKTVFFFLSFLLPLCAGRGPDFLVSDDDGCCG